MPSSSPSPDVTSSAMPAGPPRPPLSGFFVWREFLWGGLAGSFGEGIMHPIDTVKTRIQSQAIISSTQAQKNMLQMVKTIWVSDGLRACCGNASARDAMNHLFAGFDFWEGFYRGVTPGVSGSIATGATYFGVIESTKNWLEEVNPRLSGHWSHFIAGAIGDTLGSVVYVPCEVVKQRMQVQGTRNSWTQKIMKENSSRKPGERMYGYYSGMFQAGHSICKQHGIKGLFAGYWSTLARDVPFSGLLVTFYEILKDVTTYGKQTFLPNSDLHLGNSFEGLVLGGLAGGFSAYLTTPLDVIKTRLQVQGSTIRYNGWLDALRRIWMAEGLSGMFKGSVPRMVWYIPASALTFMAVEFLRDNFNKKLDRDIHEITSISLDGSSNIQEAT